MYLIGADRKEPKADSRSSLPISFLDPCLWWTSSIRLPFCSMLGTGRWCSKWLTPCRKSSFSSTTLSLLSCTGLAWRRLLGLVVTKYSDAAYFSAFHLLQVNSRKWSNTSGNAGSRSFQPLCFSFSNYTSGTQFFDETGWICQEEGRRGFLLSLEGWRQPLSTDTIYATNGHLRRRRSTPRAS